VGDLTLKYLLFGEDRTASRTLKKVGDDAGHTGTRLEGVGRVLLRSAPASSRASATPPNTSSSRPRQPLSSHPRVTPQASP